MKQIFPSPSLKHSPQINRSSGLSARFCFFIAAFVPLWFVSNCRTNHTSRTVPTYPIYHTSHTYHTKLTFLISHQSPRRVTRMIYAPHQRTLTVVLTTTYRI